MQIGSKPGEMVFQAREGGDTFLVLNAEEGVLYLYRTVDTLLHPPNSVLLEYKDTPHFWPENIGMMSILEEVCRCDVVGVEDQTDAEQVLLSMEAFLEKT